MLTRLRRVTRHDDGASAVEYGLLVAAIAAVIIVIVFSFGNIVQEVFADTCETITDSSEPIDLTNGCETGSGTGSTPTPTSTT